ncbi:DNA cytosine methyltransferase, partial [Aeromonas salmonicida]|uniref:DNA cytosine methyltransferase n=1 Tax=Aeromonas salmonicida TaxID=645 RepID=UPI0035C23FF2
SAATAHIKALDLFAGTGWGVACQRLGIKEAGVEIMPEAVATREANGMETIYRDVWDGLNLTEEQHREAYGSYGLLIASPPCQTFSMAGNGKGREALNEVIEAIELHAYKDAAALHAFGEKHDPRTALVLTPLAYAWRDMPRLVAFEQVPTVLPVWEACADLMREWGYEVKVEILNAEQYGVPQTRKRAILVARRGGPVHLPQATHSRYYSRTPEKLDPGVKKWVSMAEALGWTTDEAEGSTYTGN